MWPRYSRGFYFLLLALCLLGRCHGQLASMIPPSLYYKLQSFFISSANTYRKGFSYTARFTGSIIKEFPCTARSTTFLFCTTFLDPFEVNDTGYYRLEVPGTNSLFLERVYIHKGDYELTSFEISGGGNLGEKDILNVNGGVELTFKLQGDVFYSEDILFRVFQESSDGAVSGNNLPQLVVPGEVQYLENGELVVKTNTPPVNTPEYWETLCVGQVQANPECILSRQVIVSFDKAIFSTSPLNLTFGYIPQLKVAFVYTGVTADLGETYLFNQGRVNVEASLGAIIDASNITENVAQGNYAFKQENRGMTIITNTSVPEIFTDNTPNAYFQGLTLLQELCLKEHDLVFTCSYGFQQQTLDVSYAQACSKNATRFVNIGGYKVRPQVSTAFAKVYQMRYLMGIIAGEDLLARKADFEAANPGSTYSRDCIGYIATLPTPEVQRGINAFMIGCRESYEACKVKVLYIGAYADGSIENDAAGFLWNVGECDVLTQHTDSLEPQLYFAERGGSILGYNSDNRPIVGDDLLASAIFNWEVVFGHFVLQIDAGSWSEEFYFPGFAEGAVQLSLLSPKVTPLAKQKVEALLQIMAGLPEDEAYGMIFCGPLRAKYRFKQLESGGVVTDEFGNPEWEELAIPEQINKKHYLSATKVFLTENDNITATDCLFGLSMDNPGEALVGDAFPEPFDADRVFNDYLLEGVELFDVMETIYGNIKGPNETTSDSDGYPLGDRFFEPRIIYPECDGTQWTRERGECDLQTLTTPVVYATLFVNGVPQECGTIANNETGKIIEPSDPPFLPAGLDAPPCDYIPLPSFIGVASICVISVGMLCLLVLLGLITKYRHSRYVLSSQPTLMRAVLCIALCLVLSLGSLLGEPTDATCLIRIWTLSLFFDLMFGIFWAKIYRIYVMYKYARRMKRVRLLTRDMILMAVYLTLVDVAILLAWTILDTPVVKDKALNLNIADGVGTIAKVECTSGDLFHSVSMFYKMLLSISNCYLVYLLRDLPNMLRNYIPYKFILLGSYNTAMFMSLVFLLSAVVEEVIIKHIIYIVSCVLGTVILSASIVVPSLAAAKGFVAFPIRPASESRLDLIFTRPEDEELSFTGEGILHPMHSFKVTKASTNEGSDEIFEYSL